MGVDIPRSVTAIGWVHGVTRIAAVRQTSVASQLVSFSLAQPLTARAPRKPSPLATKGCPARGRLGGSITTRMVPASA